MNEARHPALPDPTPEAPAFEAREIPMRANGLRHHVLAWNEGGRGPVVLCHGFLDLAWSWDAVARYLAGAGWHVIAFDWRGHGETDWVGAGGYYHFANYVLDLHELLEQLGARSVHLVGHSMGGTACALYAGLQPERLASLGLVEGLGPRHVPVEETVERYRRWLDDVARQRGRAPRVMGSVDDALHRMRIQNPKLPDALGRFLATKATRPADGGEGLVWRFDPLHRTRGPVRFRIDDFMQHLHHIAVPALVVADESGYRLPDEDERLRAISDARFVEVRGGGHMLHWLAPRTLAQTLLDFLPSS